MRIEIEKTIDESTKDVYGFNILGYIVVVFISYHREIKPNGKRKWIIYECWDSYSPRNSTIPEPELPPDIKYQAEFKVKELVSVKTWSEYIK